VVGDSTSALRGVLWRRTAIIIAACTGLALALWLGFIALLALVLSLTSDARIIANLQDASHREVLSQRRRRCPRTPALKLAPSSLPL